MSLINALKAAKNNTSERKGEGVYNGHGFESNMEAMDLVLNTLELGFEGDSSFVELELSGILSAHTEQNGSLVFTGLESVDFGIESITEKIKRTGYKSKALAKKLGNIVVGFVKRIVNIVSNKNLIVKKYGDVLEKLIDKLTVKTYDKTDIKVNIRDFSDLPELVKESVSVEESHIEKCNDEIENAKDWESFISTSSKSILLFSNNQFDLSGMTIKALDKIISDKTIIKGAEKAAKKYKFNKAKEKTVSEAKSQLLSIARSIAPSLEEDIKVQKGLRDFVKTVEEKRDELMADDSVDTEGKTIDEQNMMVNKLGPIVAQLQAAYTKLFKLVTGALQALATDIQKVLAA